MIVITGATGNIGSKLTPLLLESGQRVRVVVRNAEKGKAYAENGAELAVGDLHDAAFLGGAFAGADAVFCMLPGDYQSSDIGAHQDRLGEALTDAIARSGVKNVVFLSSVGGHTEERTGVVAGLARQERRFAMLEGVNVLILRPTYFMENFFGSMGMIRTMGINGSAIAPDKTMPIIASIDIARVAFDHLTHFRTSGIRVLPLLGPKDYTQAEFTSILGAAIGKPELPYVQFPAADTVGAMMGMGMSQSAAASMVALMEGINAGVFDYEQRTPESTTPTTAEEFAQTFAAVYHMQDSGAGQA